MACNVHNCCMQWIKLDWLRTPDWFRMTSVDVTSSVEMLKNTAGECFGKGWVITEYGDLLVISSSLFLALRSDSLASCRSCFSWSASFALQRIDAWGNSFKVKALWSGHSTGISKAPIQLEMEKWMLTSAENWDFHRHQIKQLSQHAHQQSATY